MMTRWPKLYWSRQQEGEYAAREAAGENLWTHQASEEVRNKILYALKSACPHLEDGGYQVMLTAREMVLFDTGWASLSGGSNPEKDFLGAFFKAEDGLFPTLVEALHRGLGIATSRIFKSLVNEAFNQHRVAWELIDGQMVPFESKELHTEVVEPTLKLLSQSGWDDAKAAYGKALRELAGGHGDDAITDAAAAVQETLKLLGSSGGSLGRLAKSAVSKGVLDSYDQKLIDWIEADRSNRGDAHSGQSGATREDAWLIVHVAGALILRLASGTSRNG